MEQPEFVGTYKNYEIFAKPVSGGTQYIAYKKNDINPAARSLTLDAVKGVIDVLVSEEQRHGGE